jgi:diacyltrehalose acyltransferase
MLVRSRYASAAALLIVGATGLFGAGSAAADNPPPPPPTPSNPAMPIGTPGRGYALGGAHVLGIPYDQYIMDTGKKWFAQNQPQKQIVRYPAGQVQGHTLERLFPGIGAVGDQILPGLGLDGPSIGESIDEGAPHTVQTIKAGGPGTVMGLSEGAMVLNEVQAQLANDPDAPPPDQLSFAMFGDPIGKHAFGEGFLGQMFPVGSVVPSLDYRIPAPVESQYNTYQFVSPYDSIADWPDQADNSWMSVVNAIAGLATGHTAVAFTDPSNIRVPERNIRTTVNSKGATTTTYMVPEQHLPLVMGFKYLGVDETTLNKLDNVLLPMVDAGYSRNNDPATAPITVDPAHGYDPAEVTAPSTDASFGGKGGTDPVSQLLSGFDYVVNHPPSPAPGN